MKDSDNLSRMHGDGGGEVDGESGAGPRLALDRQSAAMAVEDVFDEGQTETGAALGATLGDIDAIETLGQSRQMLRRDAGPVIAHADLRLGLTVDRDPELEGDVDALAGGAVFEGVFNQVLEDAKQLVVIAEHRHGASRLDIDGDAAIARQRLEAVDRLPDDRDKIHRRVGPTMRIELDA